MKSFTAFALTVLLKSAYAVRLELATEQEITRPGETITCFFSSFINTD